MPLLFVCPARAPRSARSIIIVAADSRFPRDGRFIERLGFFNPLLPEGQCRAAEARPGKGEGLDGEGRAADRPRHAFPRCRRRRQAREAQQSGKGDPAQGTQGQRRSRRSRMPRPQRPPPRRQRPPRLRKPRLRPPRLRKRQRAEAATARGRDGQAGLRGADRSAAWRARGGPTMDLHRRPDGRDALRSAGDRGRQARLRNRCGARGQRPPRRPAAGHRGS